MRILSTVCRAYYGQPHAVEPMYLAFTYPLRRLGHEVEHFDHTDTTARLGPDACGELFVKTVREGGFDAVLYQTGGRDQMARQAISDAAAFAPVIAWNADDDWQWDSYTRVIYPLFTAMVTTYPHIYDAHRAAHNRLYLSQWGALDLYADATQTKDLPFTFAGQIYRNRVPELRKLWLRAGLKVHGFGSLRIWCLPLNNRRFRDMAARAFPAINRAIDFQQVNALWNRSRISYTPMSASIDPKMLQIKSRAFEMGLSGTMMLSQNSPGLDRYFTPGKEFVAFESMEDCIAKARWHLRHDAERQKIADAYLARTRAEHLWEHRWPALFADIGLSAGNRAA